MADHAYPREAILDPAAKQVAGYDVLMPAYRDQLNEADVDALVTHLHALAGPPPVDAGADADDRARVRWPVSRPKTRSAECDRARRGRGAHVDTSESEEIGELNELRAGVQKKVLAHDIKQAMKAKRVSPSETARRMRTSREAVYRLLDPTRTGVTLDSLQRAASALGLTLNISFESPTRRPAQRPEGSADRRKQRAA